MKWSPLFALLYFAALFSCSAQPMQRYIFFLHNRFLEDHDLAAAHPTYGRVEYQEIIQAFEQEGFQVFSEKRPGNVNARDYALKVKGQIDSLLEAGVAPQHITVVGTSKGGYIAQYVSTFAEHPKLNFVFIGSFQESDVVDIPEINFCGNILNIYERTDPYGVSAVRRKKTSRLKINHFREIELNTGLKHGFLFKALPEWIQPAVEWARGNYGF